MTSSAELLSVGENLFSEGKFEEAIKVLKSILESQSDNDQIYFLIGRCYDKLKQFEESAKCYLKAINIDSSNTSYFINMGVCQYNMGRYEEAIK